MSEATAGATGQAETPPESHYAVSVVIPVYNEVESIPPLFEEIRAVFATEGMNEWRPSEVIFVEDASDDGTSELIDDYARAYPSVHSIHLARSWGQSAALAAGFDAARGDVVVPMDGDGQNDPADIPALLEELERGFDCVSGWRRERNDPWHKRWPSAIQTRLAKFTGASIDDFGCTLKAYRAEALDDLCLYGEGHRYIPAKLHDAGYSVTQLPVNHRPREHGESRYGAGRLIRGLADLVWHVLWYRYSSRPFHLFGGAGFVLMAIGGTIGSVTVVHNWIDPAVGLQPYLPQLLLAVGMVLFGLLTVMFGTIMEFLTRLYYDDRTEYRVERVVE